MRLSLALVAASYALRAADAADARRARQQQHLQPVRLTSIGHIDTAASLPLHNAAAASSSSFSDTASSLLQPSGAASAATAATASITAPFVQLLADRNVTVSGYVTEHSGFVAAVLTLFLLPTLLFLSCCMVRRCRRSAQARAALIKRGDQTSRTAAPLPPKEDNKDDHPDDYAEPEAPALPRLPPVDRAFLPVDAYIGVPPRRDLVL
jgi:hypothetical protein